MPFQFCWLCELLEELHRNQHKRLVSNSRKQGYEEQIVYNWYQRFSHKIETTGPSAVAFLSCLLPERRPDRVYGLQSKRLSQIYGRALGLGATRAAELHAWRNQDGADFATCVEQVLRQCENATPFRGKEVTLEELDQALDLIAAHAPSSSPALRARLSDSTPADLLRPILRRLKSHEAKWFTRMLLKSYAPVQIPEYEALHGFHFMLPKLLALQNSFDAATTTLAMNSIAQLPPRPDKNFEHVILPLLTDHVQPQLGVMIRRQPYHKGRSIKNCCKLIEGRQMSIERKYDGEYCQVHVDISKGYDCVQIFSKSGRDSTTDRVRLHGVIKDALRIERNGSRIRKQCIIEGELLVWSSTQKQIQPFHRIRRHVKHGGREIGTARDSPIKPDEHLMIAFYDILVLDDLMLLNKPHKVRRQYLKAVLHTVEGRAVLCEREVIDFRAKGAPQKLRAAFARCITNRWEGLILKGLNEPYFSWKSQNHGIKLKKDYITGLGDVADLCIVGGRRHPHAELQIGLGPLYWTTFYVGAVTNMENLKRSDAKPKIRIIDVLTHFSMPNSELLDLNHLGRLVQVEFALSIVEFDIEMGRFDMEAPTQLFTKPFIIEVMGAGFEKLSNSSFFTLRFPRKTDGKVKLHTDRTLLDTTSFGELQIMAQRSMTISEDEDSQQDAWWIEKLVQADGGRERGETVSQQTTSTRTPLSAPAISLSPIEHVQRTSYRVFVRPDTEEPETQTSRCTIRSLSATRGLVSYSPSIQPSQEMCYDRAKRSSDVLEAVSIDNVKRRRHSLTGLKVRHKQYNTFDSNTKAKLTRSVVEARTSVTHERQEHRKHIVVTKANIDMPPSIIETGLISKAPKLANIRLDNNADGTESSALPLHICTRDHRDPSDKNILATLCATNTSGFKLPFTRHGADKHAYDNSLAVQRHSQLETPPASSPPSTDIAKKMPGLLPTDSEGFPLQSFSGHFRSQTATMPDTIMPTPLRAQAPSEFFSNPRSMLTPAPIAHIQHSREQQTELSLSPVLILDHQSQRSAELSSIDADFMFSTTRFLNHFDTTFNNTADAHTKSKYHIILIDSLQPHQATNAFERLARKTQSHNLTTDPCQGLAQSLQKYNDKILVFDHRVLKHTSITNDNGKVNHDVLRGMDYKAGQGEDAALFCGVLKFYEMDIGESAGADVLRVGIELEYKFEWTSL